MKDATQDAPLVARDLTDHVLTLTFGSGRAHVLNHAMIHALTDALTDAASDTSVHVIVLHGPGHIFCAGHDLKEIAHHRTDPDTGLAYLRALFTDCATMMQALANAPQPTIAMVDGIATAAGLQMVATCDLAFASARASVCLPGINNGGYCTTPSVAVSRAIARKHMMQLTLSGAPQGADWALAAGLFNQVLPDTNTLTDHTRAFATTLASRNPGAITIGMRTIDDQLNMPLDAAYDLATDVMIGHFMDPGRLEYEKTSRFKASE